MQENTTHDAPLPHWADGALTVAEARSLFLTAQSTSVAAYQAPTWRLVIGPLALTLPNPPTRRRTFPIHDLNHLITGYKTDLRSEGEQSAWELATGLTTKFLWFIKLSAMTIGFCLAPRRVMRAYRRGRGQRNLYGSTMPLEEILNMRLASLRAMLGVPELTLVDRS